MLPNSSLNGMANSPPKIYKKIFADHCIGIFIDFLDV